MAKAAHARAEQEFTIVWEPQDGPQTALLACPVFEVFFGGARGGGKTDGMLGEFVSHGDLYGENAIGLMVRRERTQLIETIERSRQLFLPLGAKYHEQDKMWRFPNGARLRFAYLERDADADAYQGHGYTRVYVEEAGTFPNEGPILKLMATLRSGAGVPCGFRATGNPGGPGHSWVKRRYIDPAPLGWKVFETKYRNPWSGETVTRDRVFIPSRLSDNKFLGNDYVANLQMSGSPQLVKAWLEGDWSVIEGAFFDCWSNEKHVIAPFAIPDDWARFRSGDWGSAKPSSFGWWAVAGDDYPLVSGAVIPRGALVRCREWYTSSAPNVGLKLTAVEVGRGIAEREGAKFDKGGHCTKKVSEHQSLAVLDPSTFKEEGGPSIAERMNAQLISAGAMPFREADNARVPRHGAMGGWDQMRARLIGENDRPMIYYFSTCTDSIRTIPVLQHDPIRAEDLDTESEDHAADDSRYACMSRPWIKEKRKPDKPADASGYRDANERFDVEDTVKLL